MAELTAEQLAFEAYKKDNNVNVFGVVTAEDYIKGWAIIQKYGFFTVPNVTIVPIQTEQEVIEVDGVAQEEENLANEVG